VRIDKSGGAKFIVFLTALSKKGRYLQRPFQTGITSKNLRTGHSTSVLTHATEQQKWEKRHDVGKSFVSLIIVSSDNNQKH